jgi:[acyl-carrier-protein] S-malonyltransferase
MMPAQEELMTAIAQTPFNTPVCPVYQNVNAQPQTDPEVIKKNLIEQLTAPVRWTQIMENMIADGCTEVVEVGPGKVLQGLFKKVSRDLPTVSAGIEG